MGNLGTLVVRMALEIKRYKAELSEAVRETKVQMDAAQASTAGLTRETQKLEQQAGQTARQLLNAGQAAASGDYARAGQEAAGMAANMGRAGVAAGGLGMAAGVAAAALAGYLLISYKASEEAERQANILRLTGNAAGLLAGDINAMARSVAASTDGTVGNAREIAEALAGTGKIGRTAMQSVSGAVELFAQASGQSREQVTADFAKMADGVTKWAAKHNEQYHFLNLEQLTYIKALEDAGRTQEAMIVVGEAWKKHLAGVGSEVGSLQRAWRAMGEAASWAWDKALNVGRTKTTSDALEAATKHVNDLRARYEGKSLLPDLLGIINPKGLKADLDAALQAQALLQENIRLEQRSAAAKADSAAATTRQWEAGQKWDTIAKSNRDKGQQLADALAEVKTQGEAAGKSQTEIAAMQEKVRASMERGESATRGHTTATKSLTEAEKELAEQRKRDLAVGALRNKMVEENAKATEKAAREAATVEEFFRQKEIDADARWADESAKAADKIRKDELREWERTWGQVGQSFTDKLMQGGQSVRDYLEGLFRTLVLRPIIAPIGTALASAFGGGPAQGGGLMGSMGSLNNLFSMGSNFLSGATINAQAAGAWTRAGDWLSTSSNNTMAGMGEWMQGNPGGGQMMGMAGNALAGYGLQKSISNGYKTGASGLVDAATLVGSAIFGPLAGVAAGVFNRAFGRKLKDIGLEGSFGGEGGFAGQQYEFHKGGWFRSDKTKYSAMNQELSDALAGQYKALTDNTTGMAGQLKLSATALDTYTRKVKFSTKGLSEDQIVEKLNAEFGTMGDEMAALVLGTTEYTRAGETAGATLARLSTSIAAVNPQLDVLGAKLFDVGLAGADMASDLADRFGGLDAMAQAGAAYYQAFYTAGERATTTTRLMTEGLGTLGLRLPGTTAEFRELVDGLDLTTESGRQTWAALVQLGPEFAALQAELQRLADETAAKLLATFTARGQLVPALGNVAQAVATLTGTTAAFAGPVSTIHRLLGDASSGVLVFGERVTTTTAALSPAQLAVAALRGEIFALQTAASGTVVNMDGLSAALASVDTKTFAATIVGVFDLIGQRVKDTLGRIADERVAVRDAAAGILGPAALSPAQIRAGIASSTVGMPSNAALGAAQTWLAQHDANVAKEQGNFSSARAGVEAWVADQRATIERLKGSITNVVDVEWYKRARPDVVASVLGRDGKYQYHFDKFGLAEGGSANASDLATRQTIAQLTQQISAGAPADLAARVHAAQTNLNTALQWQATAASKAQQAQLDYVAALQKYSLDSSKAVTQLGRLREETVRYFESQRQLANLMTGTATSLRSTVAAFRFDQIDPQAQLASLQERFNVAYSMALSTTGETLAGYGNELNGLINPLLQKAQEAGMGGTQYTALVNTVLARAEAAATRLEANAPKDYQTESLGLLGQIDSTLAALEAGAKSADQLIVDAVNAGRDTTRDGLRAVVAALTGQAVPAFAAGGSYGGGLALVGEKGPEVINFNRGGHISTAADTERLLSARGTGDTQRLEAQVQALTEQVRELTRVAMATAVHAANTAENTRSMDKNGVLIYTATGQPVEVTTA